MGKTLSINSSHVVILSPILILSLQYSISVIGTLLHHHHNFTLEVSAGPLTWINEFPIPYPVCKHKSFSWKGHFQLLFLFRAQSV